MPIRALDVLADTRTVTVTTPLGELAVRYRPNSITPRRIAQLHAIQKLDDQEEQSRQIVEIFAAIVSWWDMNGPWPADGSLVGDGQNVPIQPEIVMDFGFPTLNAILTACGQDTSDPKPSTPTAP